VTQEQVSGPKPDHHLAQLSAVARSQEVAEPASLMSEADIKRCDETKKKKTLAQRQRNTGIYANGPLNG